MQVNNKPKEAKSIFTEWLEKLQQESWQLELLISGFALFGIYAARTVIANLDLFCYNELSGDLLKFSKLFINIIRVGWLIFFINLVIHVILRGLWIGAIGLRYVSHEIHIDELHYTPLFRDYLVKKIGSYDDFIERLEKICSVIFAYTFLLFLLFLSLMMFVVQFLLIAILLSRISDDNAVTGFIGVTLFFAYLLLGLIVFIDFISLGSFKKIKQKHISKIYFYIYRYFSFITLSFLYRPLLYNFIDNSYTKKLFYLSIPYIFIIIGGYNMFENTFNPYKLDDEDFYEDLGESINAYYYDDLRSELLTEFPNEERKINKEKLPWVSLEQFNLDRGVSSIFFRTNESQINILEKDSTITPYKSRGIKFSWFAMNKSKDEIFEKLELEQEKILDDLRKTRKEVKKSTDLTKSTQNLKLDSINKIINLKLKEYSIKRNNLERDKVLLIKQKLLSNFQFYIDTIKVNLDQCFYFEHPHYKEQGIRCFFPTDSLTKGNHTLKVVRNFQEKRNDEIERDSVILPIIKQ